MTYENFSTLRIDVRHGVATAVIDNPPLNLLDGRLFPDVMAFIEQVRDDGSVRVIVFESADPEFFIAHGDMHFLTGQAAMDAGGDLIGAEQAERIGLVNRALPADEIDGFVTTLARRIAALGPVIIGIVKTTVGAADYTRTDLVTESSMASRLSFPEVASLAQRLLAAGVQTRAGELRLEEVLNENLLAPGV